MSGWGQSTTTGTSKRDDGVEKRSFFDMYAHNMCRVSVCVPEVSLGDAVKNAAEMRRLYEEACEEGSAVVVYPELSVCGYSLDDMLQQDAILDETVEALAALRAATETREAVMVVGAPLRFRGRLFNCAVVLNRGRILGVVPKSYLPNFREFYEGRQFSPASAAIDTEVELLGHVTPFGADVVFECRQNASFTLGVEICQDVWVPIPPSSFQALAGASIVLNLSASNITIGKSRYRHELVRATSARLLAAYVYSSAGQGESTNDLAWDGQAVVCECGDLVVDSGRFALGSTITHADIDLDRIVQDRARDMTWAANGRDFRASLRNVRVKAFDFSPPLTKPTLMAYRRVAKRPYVPSDPATLAERCYEVYNIQVSGLVQRMRASGLTKLVLGVSGGLDSTHALLVCCKALDTLKLPRTNCLAYTMPGFATSTKTLNQATDLMGALGVESNRLDVRPSCRQMLADLDHPFANGHQVYDVTFENVQAGERTNHLFRIANHRGAFVVGTGDLSELAAGWCTYGVGDHMSHYSVNASLSKSLIQCVIQWVIDASAFGTHADAVLAAILATEVSPELVPQTGSDDDPQKKNKLQSTEDSIGPYDLHDFQLYHATRRGLRPSKAAFLACFAWADDAPRHPDAFPPEPQPSLVSGSSVLSDRDFHTVQILHFQRLFFRRFFLTTQFKRTCVPNAPKVGDGSSLSPRGDWRAPSDSSWKAWERAWLHTLLWLHDSAHTFPDPSSIRLAISNLVHSTPGVDPALFLDRPVAIQ